jgi:hypothetical protein
MSIPIRYIPKSLTLQDRKMQYKNILKSRKKYNRGIFFQRPKVASFKSKPSSHISNAKRMYSIKKFGPTRELARKTRCTVKALKKIVSKGEGAYFSSGSRPNQTAQSWGIARLASAVSGGKAGRVDYHILEEGCKKNSRALRLAKRLGPLRKTRKFKG